MMLRFDFVDALRRLGLSPKQAATLLSVDPKTTLRWQQRGADIPGPVEQALRAWLRMEEMGMAWRPDAALIGISEKEVAKQIRLLREHAVDLDEVLKRVAARGGPAAPWKVDLDGKRASLGDDIDVYFYALPNGGFSPSSYSRSDKPSDPQRDQPLLEDAYACIAEAIAKAGKDWFDKKPERRAN